MERQALDAVARAQRLLHSLDVDGSAANRSAVLAGLRHEVDTLAILGGLPLQVAIALPLNTASTCEDAPLPFVV